MSETSTTGPLTPAFRRAGAALLAMAMLAVSIPLLSGVAAASGWPHTVFAYNRFDNTYIHDPVDLGPGSATADISSGGVGSAPGTFPSVYLGANGDDLTFRLRLAADPAKSSAGGLAGDFYVAQIARETSPGVWTHVASVGVYGKSPSADYLYIARPASATASYQEQQVAAWNGGEIPGVRTVPALDSGVPGETFIDWRVPISAISAIVPEVTSTTPLRFFLGTSAASNLTVINKDWMSGGEQNFDDVATVIPSEAVVDVDATYTQVSGSDPAHHGVATEFDVTWQATNAYMNPLSATVTAPLGDNVELVTATTDTFTNDAGQLTWTVPFLDRGNKAATTFRVKLVPSSAQIDTTATVISGPAAVGEDLASGKTSTDATGGLTVAVIENPNPAVDVTVTPVVSPITYGDTWSETSFSYTAAGADAAALSGSADYAVLDSNGAVVADGARLDAGTYTVVMTGLTGDNTNITYATGTFTVKARPLTLTVDDSSSVYGDAWSAGDFDVLEPNGLADGDTPSDAVSGSPTFTVKAGTEAVASGALLDTGAYTVDLSGFTAQANYTVTEVPGTFTVTARPVLAAPATQTISAGDNWSTDTFTLDVAGLHGTAELAGAPAFAVLDSDGQPIANGSAVPVGSYVIDVTGLTAPANHSLTVEQGTFTVTDRTVTVAPAAKTTVYGTPLTAADLAIAEPVGLLEGDELSGSPTFTVTDVGGQIVDAGTVLDAGTYTISVDGLAAPDGYTIAYETATFTVDRAVAYVLADPVDITYGDIWNVDDFTLAPPVGLVAGDTLSGIPSFTVTDSDGAAVASGTLIDAGSYDIDVTGVTASANYSLNVVTSALRVAPKAVTISPNDAAVTFGDVWSTGDLTLADVAGLVGDDTVTGAVTFTVSNGDTIVADGARLDAGTYPLTVSGAKTSANYALTVEPATFTVTARAVTVAPANTSAVYGDAWATADFAVNAPGLAAGDTISDAVTGAPTYAVRASNATTVADGARLDVGAYTVAVTGLSAATANYNVTVSDGTFTVTPRPVVVTPSSATVTFPDGHVDQVVHTVAGLAAGDEPHDAVSEVTYTITDADNVDVAGTSPLDAGTYTLAVASMTTATNYTSTTGTGTLVVAPRTVTVTVTDRTITYGDTWTASDFTVSDPDGFHDDTLALAGTATYAVLTTGDNPTAVNDGERLAPASYTIAVTGLTAPDNYILSTITGVLTVEAPDANAGPMPADDRAGGQANEAVTVDVLANDTAGESPLVPSRVSVTVAPENATIAGIDPATGKVSYEPHEDFVGQDSFTYQVCDTRDRCASATVNISTPPLDLAIGVKLNGTLVTGQTATYNVTVTNNGPWDAEAPLTLNIDVPAGLANPSASGVGWEFSAAPEAFVVETSAVMWMRSAAQSVMSMFAAPQAERLTGTGINGLAAGESSVVTVTTLVEAANGELLVLGASVAGPAIEMVYANNDASAAANVTQAPAPQVPTAPDVPGAPQTPTDPGTPAAPDTPEDPDAPAEPESPEAPTEPDAPAEEAPVPRSAPEAPTIPAPPVTVPDAPATPGEVITDGSGEQPAPARRDQREETSPQTRGRLADTGASVPLLVFAGSMLIAAGAALHLTSRREDRSDSPS